MLELPQGRGQVLDRAGDLKLGPVGRLAIGDVLLKVRTYMSYEPSDWCEGD